MPSSATTVGAYIDLKKVHFFLEDAYGATFTPGSITTSATAAMGATTCSISGFTGILDVGIFVTFGTTDTTNYTVLTTTQTSGNTTSFTFSPALAVALTSGETVNIGNNQIEVTVGEGNLTYDEKYAREYKLNRGLLDQVRDGDQAPMDVSFTFAWIYITNPAGVNIPTFEDCLKQRGNASTWVSAGLACEPFAVNLVLLNKPTTNCSILDPIEEIILPAFRYESLAHDPKAGTVTCTGKCNALQALVTRYAAR